MKNKIHNYDFLVAGAGLIGSLAALNLIHMGYKVLVIDKNIKKISDKRTLAVNANSKDFLSNLGLWDQLISKPQKIDKIVIKDSINKSPLIFENKEEEMGNVIMNSELLKAARKFLLSKKIIIQLKDFEISQIKSNQILIFNGKKYLFKNIILSVGKKFSDEKIIKKISFPNNHHSYVGFFNHSLNHNQTAYEIFTSKGPLAVLPSPTKKNGSSTFIYSTKNKLSKNQILKLIEKHFHMSHGNIKLNKDIYKFEVSPHFSKELNKDYILIGDILRSIHPVAGQGWNLGISDIQVLCKTLERYKIDDPKLINNYYYQRSLQSMSYLSFTSLINFLYENQNPIFNFFIKTVFIGLQRVNLLRQTFIKQAMGRLNLI